MAAKTGLNQGRVNPAQAAYGIDKAVGGRQAQKQGDISMRHTKIEQQRRLGFLDGQRQMHGQHGRIAAGPRTQYRRDSSARIHVERQRSEEHTSELQSLMRISYA